MRTFTIATLFALSSSVAVAETMPRSLTDGELDQVTAGVQTSAIQGFVLTAVEENFGVNLGTNGNYGFDNKGKNHIGVGNRGNGSIGYDNRGSGHVGFMNRGSGNTGAMLNGSGRVGFPFDFPIFPGSS